MSKPRPKTYHEDFARFFDQPTRDGLRELLKRNIGEFRLCDFKESLPEGSALGRHILALANSGGGCLVIGVAEKEDKTLDPVGVSSLADKADITNQIKAYLPGNLLARIDIIDFAFDATEYAKLQGKKFQVIFVESDPTELPYVAPKAGTSIRQNAIYVRREGSSEEASHDELQQVLNRRLETGYSSAREMDLKAELEQLRVLYDSVSRAHVQFGSLGSSLAEMLRGVTVPNPKYPSESFEDFVLRMIERKKLRIHQKLGL